MNNKLTELAIALGSLPRPTKRLITIAVDLAVLPIALWSAFALRFGTVTPDLSRYWWLFIAIPVLTIPVLKACGLYREVLRYMGPQAAIAVLKGVTVSAVMLGTVALLGDIRGLPRTVVILYWLTALLYIGGSRMLLRALLQSLIRRPRGREPVIVYGAGAAGAQLITALDQGYEYTPVALVDDDVSLGGSKVHGLKVYAPSELEALIERTSAQYVLLALPAASRQRRLAIFNWLEPLPVHVKTVPSLNDMVSGVARVDELRDIEIEDLLGRDQVAPDQALLDACIRGKNVLVTGAGGSIGSELCRQIVRLAPRRLVLFEISEFGLYEIERELRAVLDATGAEVELVAILGTVQDRAHLAAMMKTFSIATVYHAAAYKHVPMVEHNVLEGIRNNTRGTLGAARAALEAGVESFVLISTDKAVRPTNVMGASKRVAELILQGLAQQGGKTTFCMVRFGNVLGSSGSVVPLFREQIRAGGPVTITHPEITRYFMTLTEAAALVIQAGALARGGDVFVLDMGEPVRILDLARKMIRLMGHHVREGAHPDGGIEIQFTGLRPGEKLFEELLIGTDVEGTSHPMILRAMESSLSWPEVQRLLARLDACYESFDCAAALEALKEAVSGFVSKGPEHDLIWSAEAAERNSGAKITYLRAAAPDPN